MITILPWLVSVIPLIWDPLSEKYSQNLSHTMSQLLDFDPTTDQLSSLLQSLLDTIESTISSICLPVTRTGSELGLLFSRGQLMRCIRLLRNIGLFSNFISPRLFRRLVWKVLERSQNTAVKLLTSNQVKLLTSNQIVIIIDYSILYHLILLMIIIIYYYYYLVIIILI